MEKLLSDCPQDQATNTGMELHTKVIKLRAKLRPGQIAMADWQGGQLGVSAVPGAGKSTGMAIAAALTIARLSQIQPRQLRQPQLIIVTFTRAAAANIKNKIRTYLKEDLGLPSLGFAVHTLHGLALNIAQTHSRLSGLNLEGSTLIDPTKGHRLIKTVVEQWISQNPQLFIGLLSGMGGDFDGEETERLRRSAVLRTEILPTLVSTVVHEAKSSGLSVEALRELSYVVDDDYQTLAIAAGLYAQYEHYSRQRNFLDYDDMILGALRVLENPNARNLWQQQVYAVFEDEAQDSSPLQAKLLEIIATPADGNAAPNLIRVGDPNQAINSTFTPADPVYFRRFCLERSREGSLATMDQAGRSSQIIIDAANFVLKWVNQTQSKSQLSPFQPQQILPVAPGDPQPEANPEPTDLGLEIHTPVDIYETVELLSKRTIALFQAHPDRTMAILVRENRQGSFLAQQLQTPAKAAGLLIYEVHENDRHSHIPKEILCLLQFLDRPHSPDYLKAALEILVQRQLVPAQDLNALVTFPEQFLYPSPLDPPQSAAVTIARRYCTQLLRAKGELPLYHLPTFLAFTLRYDQAELATNDKLTDKLMERLGKHQRKQDLGGAIDHLQEIINTEKLSWVEIENPEAQYIRPGQLTIITMHKAKGLDWDYVFLPFLNEDVIPGSLYVPAGAKFLGEYTLAEVARAQIRAKLHTSTPLSDHTSTPLSDHTSTPFGSAQGKSLSDHETEIPLAAQAWQEAEYLKTAEEFRLLYVAMTRAKRLLWLSAEEKAPFSWSIFNFQSDSQSNVQNNLQGNTNLSPKKPCPVIPALQHQFPQCVVSGF
ncbi:MAG: ATP-dependent helicase [Coleofasciculaceae cyanobacterium SM2_1_6]|nr:ATP-dependent helicase [Coleofasciculaceae cyanobacterium SM2_1_6]